MDKQTILKAWEDKEDKMLISLVFDRLESSRRKNCCVFSDFLDSTQEEKVKNAFSFMKNELVFLSKIINSQSHLATLALQSYKIPTVILKITTTDSQPLKHGDILGAIMSLGIKRQKIGDIIFVSGICYIEVKEEIADFIIMNLSRVRNSSVDIIICENEKIERVQEYEDIFLTVSSLRLDCVVSSIVNLSREKVKDYISMGNVKLNHTEEKDVKKNLKEGDILSLRKSGRYLFFKENGFSQKGKNKIIIKKYI